MRVLIDGRPIRHPISGVAQYTCNLADELRLIPGLETRLFTLEFGSRAPHTEFVLHPDQLVHVSKIPRKLFNIGVEHLKLPLASWICGKADIVHETFFGALPMRPRCPLVSTIHDVIPIEQPEKFSRMNATYSRRNFWRQLKESTAIIAVSEYTRQRIIEVGKLKNAANVHVVPNGVRDLSLLASSGVFAELKRKHGIDRPFILYMGNLEPRKGVVTLLRAFAKSRLTKDMQLVIAGRKCWGYDEIEAVVAELGPRDIVLPGYVSEAEKAALLGTARVFVYPSTYEGFGIPVLEAMNCGCPVIVARNSSLTELGDGAGILFETGSVTDLADKLDGLLGSSSLHAQLVVAGRERAQRYTWRRAAEATAAIYRQALNEK
jgi:glycosyltransferase involved in cell wall biosynthesis